jgi:hypothetical protein
MLYLGNAQVNIRIGENGKDNEGGNPTSSGTVVDVSRLYTPKNYAVHLMVGDTLYELDYNISNPNNCTCGQNDWQGTEYLILDGKLFQVKDATKGMAGLSRVGDSTKWTDITGRGVGTDVLKNDGIHRAIGICDGQLYSVFGTEATLLNAERGWTKVVGYSHNFRPYSYSSYRVKSQVAAIKNGSLHRVWMNNSGVLSVGGAILNNVTDVVGVDYCNEDDDIDLYMMAYAGDEIYWVFLSEGNETKVVYDGKYGKFNKITGTAAYAHYGYGNCAGSYNGYAIDAKGNLYTLAQNGCSKVNVGSGWTNISGHGWKGGSTIASYGLGIQNGKLYYMYFHDVYQLGTDTDWTAIYGFMGISEKCDFKTWSNKYRRAFGVRQNTLYRIDAKKVKSLNIKKPIKVCPNEGKSNTPSLIINEI